MKLKILILIFVCIWILPLDKFYGQELADEPLQSNSSGEEHSSLSDVMRAKVRQNGERLFVIIRLGDGENSRQLVMARMKAARNYFLRDDIFKAQSAIFAEGERVKGKGRFEYYLGSKLQFVALAPRNKIINFTCCMDYFPPTRRIIKRKKAKR